MGICLFGLVLAAAAMWSGRRTRTESRAHVEAEAASMATIAADYLNQYLDGLDTLASALRRHPAIQSTDIAECNRVLAALLVEQPMLLNVALRGADGQRRCAGIPAPPRAVPLPVPAFALQTLATGRTTTSEIVMGTVSLRPVIARGYPVYGPDGTTTGVLALSVNTVRLQSVFQKVTMPKGSVVSIVDAQGKILSRTLDPQRYVATVEQASLWRPGVPLPILRTDVDNIRRFHGDVLIERGPWLLSVGIPQQEVLDRVAASWRRNLAITMISVALLLALSLFISHQASRGLRTFTLAAKRIAEGDLSPPVSTTATNLETAQLQNAFTTMAANLRETRAELQSLQRQMVRQERLAAVGLLVSGVAHELNNPLQAILGTVEMLERSGRPGPDVLRELAIVKAQSGRAREIIRNLARFSAQQPQPPAVIDLRYIVSEVVQRRRHDLENSSIDLTVDVSGTQRVYANPAEIEQATLHLVTNAQQAIESTGRGCGRMLVRVFDADSCVRVEVHDDGPGVPAEDEAKLFQPFFTTRPVGEGTGLGLAVSYGIIDAYGGSIGHRPNAWGGATFYFELPAIALENPASRTTTVSIVRVI